MHHAMWVFYQKYFQKQSSPLTSAAVWAGIQGSLAGSLIRIWTSRNIVSRTTPAARLAILGGLAMGMIGFWAKHRASRRNC
jgi:hypothetical protein